MRIDIYIYIYIYIIYILTYLYTRFAIIVAISNLAFKLTISCGFVLGIVKLFQLIYG